MTWFESHLPKAEGIVAATERQLLSTLTCHKCNNPLGEGKSLVVHYDSPEGASQGAYLWQILCYHCKTGLARRIAPLVAPRKGSAAKQPTPTA